MSLRSNNLFESEKRLKRQRASLCAVRRWGIKVLGADLVRLSVEVLVNVDARGRSGGRSAKQWAVWWYQGSKWLSLLSCPLTCFSRSVRRREGSEESNKRAMDQGIAMWNAGW